MLQAPVVPDGVADVVLRFTNHQVSMAIHDNVGIAGPVSGYAPKSITWYAADGNTIRTFYPHY